jgi:ketosteroid isomerase-like protein
MNKPCTLVAMLFICVSFAQDALKNEINGILDQWHSAAARADFDTYFGHMTSDAVFIGTDATEYWLGEEFKEFAKPYFERGKAWSFQSMERHIYLNEEGDLGWFDELLDTRMELCRGSGVVRKVNNDWKIAHYVLSIAVPNDEVDELVKMKKVNDSLLLIKLRPQ